MKIGIPRALLYYWYGNLWERFWEEYGQEVVVSPPTDRQIVSSGAEVAVDELCLPVKIFLGHVRTLLPRTDAIMIPHLIKVESDAYICPKFMGLPDLVRNAIPELHNNERLLTAKVGTDSVNMVDQMERIARRQGYVRQRTSNPPDHRENPALQMLRAYQNDAPRELVIGLLGHPYCLYDAHLNLNMMNLLAAQSIGFVTPENLPPSYEGVGSGKLPKKLFWTLGRRQFDALEWMLHDQELRVAGFIHLAPFACGPEAIVGDMLERRIRVMGKPVLKLNFEEHSGEAGLVTRLEAFIDLLKYRYKAC